MWGICLTVDEDNLYQKAVEYQPDPDNRTIHIIQPVTNKIVSINDIKVIEIPPIFIYGDFVSPANHPDTIGKIETIIWHFKNNEYNYYISVNGKKVSKRYDEKELIPCCTGK